MAEEKPKTGPGTETQPNPNLSTENQLPGDAGQPTDKLDRDRPAEDDGGRRSSLTK